MVQTCQNKNTRKKEFLEWKIEGQKTRKTQNEGGRGKHTKRKHTQKNTQNEREEKITLKKKY